VSDHCKVCGAPVEFSDQVLKKEGDEPTRCAFCSAPRGSKYRPFEVKFFQRKRLYSTITLLFSALLITTTILIMYSVYIDWQAYSCLSKPIVERLISGCVQSSALLARAANLRVLESSALPEQHRLLQAILLNNVKRIQFKRGEQFLFDVEASAMPLHLLANGNWLLLGYSDRQLSFYAYDISGNQATPIKLDLQACQPDTSAPSINFLWSPDRRRMIISAASGGIQRIKLATLNLKDARIEQCYEAHSRSVNSIAWLSNDYLLYLTEEGGRKRVEVSAVAGLQPVFSSELRSITGVLSNLQVSPSGQHVLFTDDLNGQRQLYWLNLSEQPTLYALKSAEYHLYPSRFFGWANDHQIAYVNSENQLVLLDLQAQTISFMVMPPSVVWMAWQGED
jgi:hypothetical protein